MAQPYIPPETKYTRAAVLLVGAQTRIAAPASHVFKAHTDIKRYPEWNTFSANASASADPLCEGASLTLKARMSSFAPALPIFLTISEISTPDKAGTNDGSKIAEVSDDGGNQGNNVYRISWDATTPNLVLSTHRVTEVTPDGDDACLFTTYETMSGGASYLVRMLLQNVLQGKFEGWCAELKGFAERTWDEGRES